MASETKIRVRYAETDKMAIVHHAVYPVWFEAARGDYIRSLGMGYDAIEAAGYMLPLHDLNCKYIRPCEYEETITVRTKLLKANGVKLVLGYEVWADGEDSPRVTGSTTHAWVHTSDFSLANLKKEAPEIYALIEKGKALDME